jgi:predicted NBD/HSP70 family sugar kinase
VAAAVRDAASGLRETAGHPARLAVVSAADPVDRATGRLVQLPDAPFLVGELDPVTVLAPEADGPVIVDNDVNWAARAERDHDPAGPADFAYLFLDEGLGCAVVSDGEVMRGRHGLAGEIAHLLTAGPDGTATRLIEVFARLGLRRPASTAIDGERLLAGAAASRELRGALGRAVGGAVAALVAVADPEVVVVGGSWGPALLDTIGEAVTGLPRPVPVRAAAVTAQPALTGARAEALRRLRTAIVAAG